MQYCVILCFSRNSKGCLWQVHVCVRRFFVLLFSCWCSVVFNMAMEPFSHLGGSFSPQVLVDYPSVVFKNQLAARTKFTIPLSSLEHLYSSSSLFEELQLLIVAMYNKSRECEMGETNFRINFGQEGGPPIYLTVSLQCGQLSSEPFY